MGWRVAQKPADEAARLAELRSLSVLDSPSEAEFDAIVRAASEICETPIALVSLVDENRTWFKASVGLPIKESPRETSFCSHAILGDKLMEVPDMGAEPDLEGNPARFVDPPVNFYAGVPLMMSSGHRIGTLCVVDYVPRKLDPAQRDALVALGKQVVRMLELRRARAMRRSSTTSSAEESTITIESSDEYLVAPRRTSRLAILVLGILALGSLLATFAVDRAIDRSVTARLDQSVLRTEQFIAERTAAYTQIVRGVAALFGASESVSREQFRAYVTSLELKAHYPGVLGVGFARNISAAELDDFVAAQKLEVPEFRIHGPLTDSLTVTTYIEPLERNLDALGFNMQGDATRSEALQEAVRANDIVATRRLVLLQDPRGGPGFLFVIPVQSVRGDKLGYAFVVVRGRDFVRGISDEAGETAIVRIRDEADAGPLLGPEELDSTRIASRVIDVAERSFRIDVGTGPLFVSRYERMAPGLVFALGAGMALLAFGLVLSSKRVEVRAEEMARNMTQALRRSAIELRSVVDGTSDLIVAFDAEGKIVLANRAFRDTLGYLDAATTRRPFTSLLTESEARRFEAVLEQLRGGQRNATFESAFLAADGVAIEVEGRLETDPERKGVVRAIFRDVSIRRHSERALRAANESLERLATVDALTSLGNRRRFDERIDEEIGRARRAGSSLAVVLLDVDNFKKYNDTYGHLNGDDVLRRIGATLADQTRRAGELAARYGGEEFALILPGVDREGARAQAERVRAAIEELAIAHGENPGGVVTASLGLAMLDDCDSKDPEAFVAAADAALYRAKASGRNRVVG